MLEKKSQCAGHILPRPGLSVVLSQQGLSRMYMSYARNTWHVHVGVSWYWFGGLQPPQPFLPISIPIHSNWVVSYKVMYIYMRESKKVSTKTLWLLDDVIIYVWMRLINTSICHMAYQLVDYLYRRVTFTRLLYNYELMAVPNCCLQII